MSPENYSNIIQRIKKLFALSKSSNENEAALALERARQMMLKYNIEQNDLVKDSVEDIIEVDFELASRSATPNIILALDICKAFMVKSIIIKKRIGFKKIKSSLKFIGSKTDVATATYVYSYMVNIVEERAKDYFESVRYTKEKWSPLGAKKVKSDYAFGFITAVCEKLKKIEEDRIKANPYEEQVTNALVVVKDALIEKYIDQNIGETKSQKVSKSYNRNHFNNGFDEGEKQGIFRGVGKSEDKKSLR